VVHWRKIFRVHFYLSSLPISGIGWGSACLGEETEMSGGARLMTFDFIRRGGGVVSTVFLCVILF